MSSTPTVWFVVSMLVIITILLVLLYWVPVKRLVSLGRLGPLSASCESFYTWTKMLQRQTFLNYTDHSDNSQEGTQSASVPHIILCNHIPSHMVLGSFLTIAGAICSPCNIVCYQRYTPYLPLVSNIVERILQKEIRIDRLLGHVEKEARMVEGMRDSLEQGRNVVMFIDAHCSTSPMRSLNHKVLGAFPDVSKQLVHIMQPTGVNNFHFRRLPATKCLETILVMREQILASVHSPGNHHCKG